MENQIKLICSDVDGTLINSQGKISSLDKNAIERARVEFNIPFVIVSGRFRGGLGLIQNQLLHPAAISCFNGLYVEINGKVVKNTIIDNSYLLQVLPIIRKFNCVPVAFSLDGYAMEDANIWYEKQVAMCGFDGLLMPLEEAFAKQSFYKILAKSVNHEDLVKLNEAIVQTNIPQLTTVFSSPNILEILPAGTDKASTIDSLVNFLNIGYENVIAFGDYDNDIGMLKRAGLGVAMANAQDSVKEVANFITKSNEDSGIAFALDKFVFSK